MTEALCYCCCQYIFPYSHVSLFIPEKLQVKNSNVYLISLCLFSRSTVLVKLNRGNKKELRYEPGDHLSVFPSNEAVIVDKLIGQLKNAPYADSPIRIDVCSKDSGEK